MTKIDREKVESLGLSDGVKKVDLRKILFIQKLDKNNKLKKDQQERKDTLKVQQISSIFKKT